MFGISSNLALQLVHYFSLAVQFAGNGIFSGGYVDEGLF